ncbi:MAG: chromosome segregation protein SMC [Gemmatimonadaceae bacterium]
MRLTKLELHGFKSFADHTEMVFEPGATMIVGPNGCGKSNVSDAVRWVLGEQRARLLRGAKMEEVIFQGSSARRPVNVAEISLHFDNTDGTLPIAFQEVVITRRLSRSGESEYFLNRAPCRLRDIADLLRGTGLGGDAGVVIEAKAIDALLSERPDDRRELFEEAAGVGLYRDRRRSTERRLEETTVDLQRLDDLIAEVQSQVRSLARQRKRAERHAEITQRRFAVEIALAAREMAAWKDELARLETRVADLRERLPGAEEALEQAEAAREEAQGARAAAEARRAELARLVSAQRQHVLQLQGELAVAEERQRNAVARRSRAEEERRAGQQVGERVAAELEQAAADRRQCEAELRDVAELLEGRAAVEEETRGLVHAARAALEQLERRGRELHEQMRRLELDLGGAHRELAEVRQREEALEVERQQLADRAEGVRRELAAAEETLALAKERVAVAASELERARAAAREAREREQQARAELLRAADRLTALQGRVNAIEALERERVGLAPAAAALLRERDRFGDGAVLGPLSDFISADAGAALTVERFLGNTVHAVLVRDAAAADEVRRWHAEAAPGPLLLLPLDAHLDDDPAHEPEGAIARLVQAAPPGDAWVRALLGHATAVDDGAAFVDARGAVWLPGTGTGPGPLQRRAELVALRGELEAALAANDEATRRADEAREALAVAERAQTAAAEESNQAQGEARHAEDVRGDLERRRQRAERELADAQALAERLAARHEELASRARGMEERAEALGETLQAHDAELREARERAAEAERALEEAREARTVGQVSQAQAQARLQVAADRERRLAEEQASASGRIQSLLGGLATLEDADSTLAQQMASWRLDIETRQATLDDGERALADAESGLAGAEETLHSAELTLAEARRVGGQVSEELHAAQLRYTELSGRRGAIRERLEAEWRKPLDELLANAPELAEDDDTLRAEAELLRSQLDALGPVNPLAIEEHEEEQKRLEFLSTQRDDLYHAKHALQQAIREIDSTARELFLQTFAQVRENFRHIFMTLFGGGECDLRLENPESPLDCDIEVHASPRGKRTQRIHLLSSGERALVALSLLFGIFLTRPSPFCLLDEVDAPLDDQNVGRFVRMLNEFKRKTQFIVITHNPRTTTEAADAVYGVTMQEPGVSSVVSVRLRGAAVEEAIAGAVREPAGV